MTEEDGLTSCATPLCLDHLTWQSKAAVLPCLHEYCEPCITSWLELSGAARSVRPGPPQVQ